MRAHLQRHDAGLRLVGHIREQLGDFDDWIAEGLRQGGATAIETHDAQQQALTRAAFDDEGNLRHE